MRGYAWRANRHELSEGGGHAQKGGEGLASAYSCQILIGGRHPNAVLEIDTGERVALGRAMVAIGSVDERVGGGGSSSSGECGQAGGGGGEGGKPSFTIKKTRSGGRGGVEGLSVDDVGGDCGRFFNIRFLCSLSAHHHRKQWERKTRTFFFELCRFSQHFHPWNTPMAATRTPTTATASPP